MLHDPDLYACPMEFDPSRFFGECPERNLADFCFGFGRRYVLSLPGSDLFAHLQFLFHQESVQVRHVSFDHTLDTHPCCAIGLQLAEASVFVACAMSLAVLNIQEAKAPDGQLITPKVDWSSGLLRYAHMTMAESLTHRLMSYQPCT